MVQASARYERLSASPGAAVELLRLNASVDVRHVLASIHVPTLVLHRQAEKFVPVENGRYLAEHNPGARMVELDGSDHLFFAGDLDAALDEIEEFVPGQRQSDGGDRVHTTLLFTLSFAGAGEVVASVKDLVAGSDLDFEEHGEDELAGLSGRWRLFRVRL